MRQQFLEVPFIALYRKEYVSHVLKISVLWRVYYMDEKWGQLQSRKKNVSRWRRCSLIRETRRWLIQMLHYRKDSKFWFRKI